MAETRVELRLLEVVRSRAHQPRPAIRGVRGFILITLEL